MNRKTICCLLLTMVLVCAAILLPGIILNYQQQTLTERVFTKPAVQLSNNFESHSVIHTLQILSNRSLSLSESDDEIDREQIQKQLNEQLCILHDSGITIPFIPNPKEQEVQVQAVTKVLYFGNENAVYAYRINTDQWLIWLDVDSGKIVKMRFHAKESEAIDQTLGDVITAREETAHDPAQELYAWTEYYGLSTSLEILEPISLEEGEFYWKDCIFAGILQDENGQRVGFSFSHQEDFDNPEDATLHFDIEPVPVDEIKQIQKELQD